MRVLVFGAKGWIGQKFTAETTHDVYIASTRPENKEECYEEIKRVSPHAIISFIGRTHGFASDGTKIPSIDYLELPGKLVENMRDNFYGPYNLAQICEAFLDF